MGSVGSVGFMGWKEQVVGIFHVNVKRGQMLFDMSTFTERPLLRFEDELLNLPSSPPQLMLTCLLG